MARLTLYTLCMPRIEYAGSPLALDRRKAVALLVYLALNDRAHSRDALATLFWPGYDQATARGNLRRTLSVLHTALHEEWLVSDRDSVALKRSGELWIDALEFARLLDECRTHGHPTDQICPLCLPALSQAATLYRDDFLTGFTLPDAPDFDDWQREQTEALRRMLSGALRRLAECLVVASDWAGAAAHARRRVALDPLDEGAQRQLMQILAWAGDRTAALRQYQACVALLRREVQAKPAPETTALYEAIGQNRLTPPVAFAPAVVIPQSGPALQPGAASHPVPGEPASPPPGEREVARLAGDLRPISVLCAGLAGEDEPESAASGVARLLQTLEVILAGYEARIDRLLGDSVVAVFGVGQVHEDDPERAVAAACALVPVAPTQVEDLCGQAHSDRRADAGISIGIASGEAYFGPLGAGDPARVAVLGPLVNRAARLQARAAAGQVLVDRATYRRTHGAFAFRLSDNEEPAVQPQVYQVVAPRQRPAKTRGIEGLRAELVGRDEELAKLAAALAKVRAGQGQMVALIGEAGVGKSRLVAELRTRTPHPVPAELASLPPGDRESVPSPSEGEGQGEGVPTLPTIAWLEGRCLELTTSTSYAPFVDMLRGHFGTLAAGGDAPCDPLALACGVREALHASQGEGLLTGEQVEEIGPLLGNLLSMRFGDDWDERLRMADPGQIRHRTFAALRALFAAWARRQPIVVVLEDLHWADGLSIDLIGELLGLLSDHPLLLLCVYRPGREYPSERLAALAERRCVDRYTELRLHPLTADASRLLLASLLTVEGLPASARELIVAQGEGNPFFTEEIVRGLIDAGLLYREGTTWRARERIEIAHAPEGVQSVILSRVDRLAAGDRQALQAASVLGRLFRPRVLARLVAADLDVAAALDRLVERDFVYLERSWPEAEYSFKHVLTQQAVYGTLLADRKRELHRQAGAAIEALYADSLAEHYEALAHHYDRGDAGEKAVEYLLKAGEKARRAYLNDEAIAYFERALARCEQAAPLVGQEAGRAAARLEALTGLGKVHFLVGRFVEAEGWLRQAISLGRGLGLAPAQLARLYFWLGDALFWQYRLLEVVALGEEGLELLGGNRESAEAALMNGLVAIASGDLGNKDKCREATLRIAAFIQRLPYEEELRPAHHAVSNLRTREKRLEEAERWLQIQEMQGKRHHDLRAIAWTTGYRGVILLRTGDCSAAVSALREALELCRQIGDVATGIATLRHLWESYLSLGELEEAERWCQSGLDDWLTREQVAAATAGAALAFASVIMLCKGDYEGALQASRESLAYYPVIPPGFHPEVAKRRARVYDAVGERAEALRSYQEALAHMQPEDMRVFWMPWHVWRPRFSNLLSGLEEACNDAAAFQVICQRYREEHSFDASASVLQWYLEPSSAGAIHQAPCVALDFRSDIAGLAQSSGWTWQDPFNDCSWEQEAINGLSIRAANGRDLFFLNRSAPRLVRSVSGDFVAETVCGPARDDRPGSGGLLLWKDEDNYLSLNWGRGGPHEICLEGCVEREDRVFGRGRLPAERTFLRLERRGARVDALCSADGGTWWSVGHAAFPTEDPVEIGLCAIGMIDRTIYPGAYREGTAIRFESFRLW